LFGLLICMWLAIGGTTTHAAVPALSVDPNEVNQTLDGHVELLLDRTMTMDRDRVLESPSWESVSAQPYSKGIEIGVVWLRFRIHNPQAVPVERLLNLGAGRVDEITVWMTDEAGSVQHFEAGENVELSDRAVHHFFPLFPVSLDPGEEVFILTRLLDEGTMNIDITLSDRDEVQNSLENRQWMSGLMSGVFSLVALYALVFYRKVREPMMGWMAALALAGLFQWTTTYGTGLTLFLPVDFRGWTSNRLIVVAYEFSAFCAFFFYVSACQLDRHHPTLTRVIKGFGWLGLINGVAAFALPFVVSVRILYLGVIGLLLTAGLVVRRAAAGDKIAQRLVLAVCVLLAGYLTTLMTEEAILPSTPLSTHYVPIATMIQWILLSEALAYRVRQIEDQRQAARQAQRLEEERTEEIRVAFGRYVAPDLAAKLLNDPDAMTLGGRMQTITILMSDLRGFTGMTDRLGPPAMCALLNDYLGRMTEVIERNGGMVNEFIGDAILTLFGTPLKGSEDELSACRCAIEMQLALEEMNRELSATHGLRLEMGIGIHTGEAVVGNIGSHRRVKWGVIGDPVNMTARIESLTVGTQVLVSADLLARVTEHVVAGPVRQVQVKGRARTLEVAELQAIRADGLAMPEPPDPQRRSVQLIGSARLLAGKELVGDEFTVHITELAINEVRFHCDQTFEEGTNVALRVQQADTWTPPIYAKISPGAETMDDGQVQTTAIITWMEPEVRTSLLDEAV